MGKYQEVAERLARHIEDKRNEGGVNTNQLLGIIDKALGNRDESFNCYPGTLCNSCYDLAFFISLSKRSNATGQGHLSCRKALEKIVQHMQGTCYKKTTRAVLITDRWDQAAYDDWKGNMEQIIDHIKAKVEVYQISDSTVSQLHPSPRAKLMTFE